MKQLFILSILLISQLFGLAQGNKSIEAKRTDLPIKVDGVLNEGAWKTAEIAEGFTQHAPSPGDNASQRTEVKVLYDNTAIYIGATCYDVSKDSILRQLSNRDEEENTDVFGIFLDTYNDDQNAYGFVVHPTGVQWDARYSPAGQDVSWDAVWMSNVTIDENNWYVEMKIPYSAIRFPDLEEQTWGVNFARKIRRIREFSFWNPTLPNVNGLVRQFGDLTGLKGIKSPVRLAFIPYLSGQGRLFTDKSENVGEFDYNFRGGMDLKYGLNDAFTLDVTLVPDFGQVQSDNQVLNLSPFEVFFQERRPFFMEGTELFNKADLFYSRRIGGRPINFWDAENALNEGDSLISNPSETQLINSTKLSGRTNKKLGIGVLNSVTSKTQAEILRANGERENVITAPLTNYNVFVLDQTLKNNSFVSLTNTNVLRKGEAHDANVTSVNYEIQNKSNTYATYGSGVLSQVYSSNSEQFGHNYELGINKISGNFTFNVSYEEMSNKFNKNDLGFLTRTNFRDAFFSVQYNTFEPKRFNSSENALDIVYQRLYLPSSFANLGIGTRHIYTTKKFHSFGLWSWHEPLKTKDFFEPRDSEFKRFYAFPQNYNFGGWVSSDYRKAFALDISSNYRIFNEDGRYRFNLRLSPRFRVSDHLFFVYSAGSNTFTNDVGWANTLEDESIIFTKRDVNTLEQSLRGNYIFTNRMGISFRFRHYWSTADYKEFFLLEEGGSLGQSNYSEYDENGVSMHDVNFNAFNIDLIYTWVFAPGSQLNITYKNSILTRGEEIIPSYRDNVNSMFVGPQTNSLNIKLLYYLDYLSLKRKK